VASPPIFASPADNGLMMKTDNRAASRALIGSFAAPLLLIRLAKVSIMLPRVEVFLADVFALFISVLFDFDSLKALLGRRGFMIIVIFEVRPSP
jgi:hypothetical protein